MAIHDTHATETGFCTACGGQLSGGRFCAHCGTPLAPDAATPFPRHDAATEQAYGVADNGVYDAPTETLPPPANGNGYQADGFVMPPHAGGPPPAGGPPILQAPPGRRRWPIVVAVVAVLSALIAAGVLIFLSTSSSDNKSPDKTAGYRQKVADTLAPVDQANLRLSDSLGDLRRGRPTAQIQAATAAQDATSSARGALGAIPVPDGSAPVAQQARQALDREQTYLKAVSTALARPADPGLSQLPTLAGNLTSALEAVDAPVGNAAQDVRGAESLTAWAVRTRRAAKRRRDLRRITTAPVTPATPATPATPSSTETNNSCGDSIYTNSSATCPFAQNVKEGWLQEPGTTNSFDAYSSALGRDIRMSCEPSGDGILCTGGQNARVFFNWG
jgi:hypothetical protein